MSDVVDRGITVTEISAVDQPIDVAPETIAAFVGRALRGPLDSPVLVNHFGEFRRRFGGPWPGSNLGPAVRQFFENGGRKLYIVRVANDARCALICLPASGSALVLRAVDSGATETIRAAVDYDGIDDGDQSRFNLTLQRIDPDNAMILDQEIFKRVSFIDGGEGFVADRLLTSSMVRVVHPYPCHRPDQTVDGDSRYELAWAMPAQYGTDGKQLSDYDLIGSRDSGTGLFALDRIEHFDILYLPPPGNDAITGPAAVLAAELYCRRRGAIQIVDPCADVVSAADAIQSIRDLGYASSSIVSYYPRVRIRGDGDNAPGVAGGAFAGLLCKLDRVYGPWNKLDRDGIALDNRIRPECGVSAADAQLLTRAGINVVTAGPAGRACIDGSVTLGRGSELHRVFRSLPVRRLCLRVVNTIDLATRWAVFEKPDERLNELIRKQISDYLSALYEIGAFATDQIAVQCDAGLARHDDRLEHGVTILLVFHPVGSTTPISFTLHQTVRGCRVATTAFAPVARNCA